MTEKTEVSRLLDEWNNGDPGALDRLMPLVIDDLRGRAKTYLANERTGHTLQPTALVNEAYLRLVGQRQVPWRSRAQFIGFLGRLMRRILVDHARRRQAEKRGGGAPTLVFDERIEVPSSFRPDLIALDDALASLADFDSRLARIVELRFFAGLKVEEVAEVLGVTSRTVRRQWKIAKLWLFRELKGDG